MGRVLIQVPIIHTQADMGALGEQIRRRMVEAMGERWWQDNVSSIDRVWDEIEASIFELALPWERVRIYQDGLPVCGREMAIVTELAAKGSRNHRLLMALVGRGAAIVGTESPELLIAEYNRIRALVDSSASSHDEDVKEMGARLLERRDRFIASRIGTTLAAGEIGILFLGMLHSIGDFLPKDIRLLNLVPFESNARRIRQALRSG